MNPQISITADEASQVVGSFPLLEDFVAHKIVATVQPHVIVQEIPQLPIVEWIQEQIVETIEVVPQEGIEVQMNTSSTSTSNTIPVIEKELRTLTLIREHPIRGESETSYTAIMLNQDSNFTRREKNHSLFH